MVSPQFVRVEQIRAEHIPPGKLTCVVYGPGHGEAILVVFPDGKVGVVDGCAAHNIDPVFQLLQEIQQQLIQAGRPFEIRFVALTHPHEDHYLGLAELIEYFRPHIKLLSTVLLLSARGKKGLLDWLELKISKGGLPPDGLCLRGLSRVVAAIRKEESARPVDNLCAKLAMVELSDCGGATLEIYGCGPAHVDVARGLENLVADAENMGNTGVSILEHDPNATSGALLLQWGQARVLLAGDLTCHGELTSSWHSAATLPRLKHHVQVVNVAHHASAEAHHEVLWNTIGPQLAVVTPFRGAGGPNPPRPEMIEKLVKSGSRVVITTPPAWVGESGVKVVPTSPVMPIPQKSVIRSKILSGKAPRLAKKERVHNAVMFSLDAEGNITDVVLAGDAAEYVVVG